ncbi:N-acetyl-gamma-glutamyl-phosphate reductase [Desulforegula conservatrix]|uniref:N-acetyl-gamma-glutamyl-phosphate reductase n=1 Tax=Desulforegula conservatrix TaxID=153026 RepID=UPI000404E742|nr:N-acetyl-gamma-glutamyl-phosphate reductase [Desulforegula conservatrix]
MLKAAIIGATGYTGAELVRILASHPNATVELITSRQYQGVAFSDIYPALSGLINLTCEEYRLDRIIESADVVFMALPHHLPMGLVPDILKAGKKIIDLSADFRFKDKSVYEAAYQAHSAPDLLESAVYGLSEVYKEEIACADLVGNPGCYPTSILLPLIPLVRAGFIVPETVIADSKSGVSGAGRSLSMRAHFCEANEAFNAYKVANHRHSPEIEQIISREAGYDVNITFVPHLLPISRGMLSTIYSAAKDSVTSFGVFECLSDFYKDKPFVRIRKEGDIPDVAHVRGTNFCDIGFKLDSRTGRLIIVSVIDNLVKGASGQAVQNMNIMCGFDETEGMRGIPYPI